MKKNDNGQTKTHWKKHFNPNYLGAYSLNPGEERVLTIIELKTEDVTSPTGDTEQLPVLHFTEGKPMILNKTNAKAAAKACGSDYVEEWAGKKVQVYVDHNVKAFGQTVSSLRIRPIKVKTQRLTNDRFSKMLSAIKAGEFKKEDAITRFELTSEQREKVEAI